jgi:hypothetical protein
MHTLKVIDAAKRKDLELFNFARDCYLAGLLALGAISGDGGALDGSAECYAAFAGLGRVGVARP